MKVRGKGYQHCVPFEFQPHRWYHVCLVYSTASWFGSLSSSSDAKAEAAATASGAAGDQPPQTPPTPTSASTGGSSIACYVDGVVSIRVLRLASRKSLGHRAQ